MATIAQLIIKAKDEASKVFKSIESAGKALGKNLKASFEVLADIGKKIAQVGVIGTGAIGGITLAAANFQSELKNTMTMTGLSGGEFAKMEKTVGKLAKTMALDLGIGGREVLQSFYYVLSTGVEAGSKGFKELSTAALKLAKTVSIDTSTAVTYVADVTKIWGKSMEESAHTAELLFRGSQLGNTTVAQLAEAMNMGGKAAAALGISMEDTAAILVAFSDNGIKGSEAGTALKQALLGLSAPSDDAAKEMKKLGINLFDTTGKIRPMSEIVRMLQGSMNKLTEEQKIQAVETLVGRDAMAGLLVMLKMNADAFDENTAKLEKASSLQDGYAEKQKTLTFQLDKMREAFNQLAIAIGEKVIPVIAPLITEFTKWVVQVTQSVEQNNNLTKSLQTAVTWIGKKIEMVRGIIPILVEWKKKIEEADFSMKNIIDTIQTVGTILLTLATGGSLKLILALLGLFYAAWSQNWLGIKDIVASVIDTVTQYWTKLQGYIAQGVNIIQPILIQMRDTFLDWGAIIQAKIQELIPILQAFWQSFIIWITPIVNKIRDELWPIIQEFINWLMPEIQKFWTEASPYLSLIWEEIKKLFAEIKPYIEPLLKLLMAMVQTEIIVALDVIKIGLTNFVIAVKIAFQIFEWIYTNIMLPMTVAILATVNAMIYGIKTSIAAIKQAIEIYFVAPIAAMYAKWEEIKNKMISGWTALKTAIQSALTAISTFINNWIGGSIKKAADALAKLQGIIDKIKGKQGEAGSAGAGASGSSGTTTGTGGTIQGSGDSGFLTGAAGGGNIIINGPVYGGSSGLRELEDLLHRFTVERQLRGA